MDQAAVLTVDGVGEWSRATYGVGEGDKLRLLQQLVAGHCKQIVDGTGDIKPMDFASRVNQNPARAFHSRATSPSWSNPVAVFGMGGCF